MQNRYLIATLLLGILVIGAIIGFALLNPQVHSPEGGPVKFANEQEVQKYLVQSEASGYSSRWMNTAKSEDMAAMPPAAQAGMPIPMPTSAGGAVEYSTTNIQVQGVDEADFVKNDQKYIYLITGGRFVIVDTFPPENAKIISNISLSGSPREMYLSGSTVVVFSDETIEEFQQVEGSAAPVPVRRQVTKAEIYDVTDRSKPSLIRTITASGTYASSRMTDGIVYLITQEYPQRRGSDIPMPLVTDGSSTYTPDIWRFDDLEGPFIFQTITAFAPTRSSSLSTESYLVGYSSTFYATPSHLYVAYTHYGDRYRSGWMEPADPAGPSTIIHRFDLNRGNPVWRQSMIAQGTLLNQFSLDDYQGHLRVATTVEEYGSNGFQTSSSITIFDRSGTITGEITGIAPTERIFAARFIGERCYLVTFRQIDPFFVIDLADPKNPKILGELKIPGYSDYLHPFDTNHIIGIGKDTGETAWGGFTTTGVKAALFDVSDVANPALKDSITIGGSGSDSEILRDHKAFYFNPKTSVMVLPVTIAQGYGSGYVWQGSYVYEITPEDGFTLRGIVPQYRGDEPPVQDRWPTAVKRSLTIGDMLATISENTIVLVDIREPSNRYGSIDLPMTTSGYGYWNEPIWRDMPVPLPV
ncbi:beta-propeller domain-containing protein [Methanocalculus sp.]|uniref:beta-propeller domain-containing protein n=1 Tax=Methanocalculus sp. TaxID=2004547 RepID=UPI002621F804|nr:beta-propeller domain-containing protein [Methanocalculus sp.]MDG6249273.1 beta-propeller domain-containing protein [Methanocalculus sp.]